MNTRNHFHRALALIVMIPLLLVQGSPIVPVAAQGPNGGTESVSNAANDDLIVVMATASDVAAGFEHTCAVTSEGGVKCWGRNMHGRLGDGTAVQRHVPVDVVGLSNGVTQVTAGYAHTCALTSDGAVKCWGYNGYGQLGDGTTTERRTPVDVVGLSSGVAKIVAGRYHTCAVTGGGGVKCWGLNVNGQLGDGATADHHTPVDVVGLSSGVTEIGAGNEHTCALTSGGDVKCWGGNWAGQLGDGTTTDHYTPVEVVGLNGGVNAIASGQYHNCVLVSGGGLKCWGMNGAGQLGDGTRVAHFTPVDVIGLDSSVTKVVAGYYHTCALTSGGGVVCWGRNTYGQLGDGTTTDRYTPVGVSGLGSGMAKISAGGHTHTCALTSGGALKCWGLNAGGQLGDGTTTDRLTPVDVVGFGGEPGPSLSISRIEINQVTQNDTDTIPFVANKHTAVRVHTAGGDDKTEFTGVLTVTKDGSPIIGSPFQPVNSPVIARVDPQPRRHEDHTLNFFVPGEVLDPGTYSFETSIEANSKTLDTHQISPSFNEKGTIRILYYPIMVEGKGLPSVSRVASSWLFMRQTYPVAWDAVELVNGGSYMDCECTHIWDLHYPFILTVLNNWLNNYNKEHPTKPADYVVGFAPTDSMADPGVMSDFPGLKSAIVEDNELAVSMQATLAHEIGHHFGLGDEYKGGAYNCDTNPPSIDTGASCSVYFPGTEFGTYDWWGAFEGEAQRVASCIYSERYDIVYRFGEEAKIRRISFMGRTGPFPYESTDGIHFNWASNKVYMHLYNHTSLQVAFSSIYPQNANEFLLMSGYIHQDDTVELDPWYRVSGTMTPSFFEGGEYSLELRDGSNAVLASYDFDVSFEVLSNPPRTIDVAPFSFVIPYPAGLATILLKHGGTIIKTDTVSENAPTVTITSPNGGESWSDEHTITWTASDLDGDSLAYVVEYTPNDSDWYPIAANITTTNFIWDTKYSPGGMTARIRVVASDGVNTGQDESDGTFTVNPKAPIASIVSPVDGVEVVSGSSVALIGVGSDLEDGQLGGASLTWSSSSAGILGTGEHLYLNTLLDGPHTITLAATDSSTMVGTDSIQITVLTDTDQDGMPDTWESTYVGLDPNVDDAVGDPDSDDLINLDELYFGTDPTDPDTDDDGYEDGFEISMDSDPLDSDSTPTLPVHLPIILKNH